MMRINQLPTKRKTKILIALSVVLPILSMLGGAALAAHRYGFL